MECSLTKNNVSVTLERGRKVELLLVKFMLALTDLMVGNESLKFSLFRMEKLRIPGYLKIDLILARKYSIHFYCCH